MVELANRQHDTDSLAPEARASEVDEVDLAEMLAVAELMESLRVAE